MSQQNSTGDNTIVGDNNSQNENLLEPKNLDSTKLSPELQCLCELLKEDMQQMLIKPLEDRVIVLEKSQEQLHADHEVLESIKLENTQLEVNYKTMYKENLQLKIRLEKIENKLMDNNAILHGVEDQLWELSAITREKALNVISSIANGKTPKEKLDVVCKIGFKDIQRLGDYRLHKNCPIILEFERKASAEFLLENKKNLPKGIYADREYSEDVERERRKLRPILRKAKQLPDFKMKSK